MSEPKNILLTVDGELREVTHGTTGLDLFREKPTTAVMRVDGLLWDLAREIPAGASVESVDITEPEGLEVLRHSTAHVMAQAVQQLRPGAKLGIGPYITDGVTNITVPRGRRPEELTAEEAYQLLADKRAKGPATRGGAKKPTARKAPAKKTTARKKA